MSLFVEAVIAANKEILEFIKHSGDEDLAKGISLGHGGDISSKVDLLAENIFIKHLSPFGNILSEECGFIDNKKEDLIVIDPIDGSDNFASKLPYYGTSVALKKESKYVIGIVVNLANGEILVKNRDEFKRAYLTNLQFKKVTSNPNSKLGVFERAYCSCKMPEILRKQGIKYRSPGAIALSLAYAHDVDFVLFEGKIREYDIAAGLLMCEDLHIKKTQNFLLVAKNKEVFDKIAKFI